MLYHPLYNEKDNDNIAYNRSNSDSFCGCVSSYRNFTTRACSDKQDKWRATNATTSGSNVTGPTNTTNKTDIGTASQIENLTKGNAGSLQNGSNIAGPSSANTTAANNTGA